MGSFAEYGKTRELAELCVQYGIDLEPLVEELEYLMLDADLAPEEIYNEFLQRAANWAGNLAGRAVTGLGNMANNFKQGYQQGTGPQQAYQQPVQQGAPQWNPNWGRQEQNPHNQADENEAPLNKALFEVEQLKQRIATLTGHSGEAFQRNSMQIAQETIQRLEEIGQLIQQVLTARYGGARATFSRTSIVH